MNYSILYNIIMDVLYDTITSKYEAPWLMFSILRELYEFDLNLLVKDDQSTNTFELFRTFLLQDKYKTNLIRQETFSLTSKKIQELENLKKEILNIAPDTFESYILFSSYMTAVIDETLRDFPFDFMNFDSILTFFIILEIFSKVSLQTSHVRDIFSLYLYKKDLEQFPVELQPKILKVIVCSRPNKLINMTKVLLPYKEELTKLTEQNNGEIDDLIFQILEVGGNVRDFIPDVETIKKLALLLLSKTLHMNMENKAFLRSEVGDLLIQLPRRLLNSILFLIFKSREVSATKITSQNKNFYLFVHNMYKIKKPQNLEWFNNTGRRKRDFGVLTDSDQEDEIF
ncbi:DhNV_085 [Dikerogammarus haemobaphes nudivirus]|nr:DhNV_085 [Dikerogammarus haemobaphes nudivirus]